MSQKSTNNVEQIRDLIFGNQIKDFEAQFGKLDDKIRGLEERMTKAFGESYSKLQKETERTLEVLEKKIDNLSSSAQRERTKLKELIDSTEENLHKQLSNQKDEFAVKLKMVKDNVSDEHKKIAEKMGMMQHEMHRMIEKGLAGLNDEKVSRDMMAQMLLDVAIKIQGTDIETMLAKGVETGK